MSCRYFCQPSGPRCNKCREADEAKAAAAASESRDVNETTRVAKEWGIRYETYRPVGRINIREHGLYVTRAVGMSEACAAFHDRFPPGQFIIVTIETVGGVES